MDADTLVTCELDDMSDTFISDAAVPPRLRETVVYIVAAVIMRVRGPSADDVDVLLIQEAKPECNGQWYLPAGRMEADESVVVALRREVKEEAGFECVPQRLVVVEAANASWFRFTFLAEVTGGRLKTLAEADKESLQAEWFAVDDVCKRRVQLRSADIVALIERALVSFLEEVSGAAADARPPPTVIEKPCRFIVFRLIVLTVDKKLVVRRETPTGALTLPFVVCGPLVQSTRVLTAKIGTMLGIVDPSSLKFLGVYSLKNACGKRRVDAAHVHDGVHLTLVCELATTFADAGDAACEAIDAPASFVDKVRQGLADIRFFE